MSRRTPFDRQHRVATRARLVPIAVLQASLIVAGCAGTPAPEGDAETGDTATGSVVEGSARPWDQARARGAEFRAIGQEPGWSLEIDQGRSIRYIGDYGQVQLTVPPPEPTRDSAGAVTYRVQADSRDLTVVIREEPCQDVMSGEAFTHAVTIRLDGRELAGCGRMLMAGELLP